MIARSSSGWLADGLAEYLDLADYLPIAEAVLNIPAETIARWPGIGLADSALHAPRAGFERVDLYPDVIDKAAVLCVRLARNHPLPDGNKRVAYLAMLEFLARNHLEWTPPSVRRDCGKDGGCCRRRCVGARICQLAPHSV